MSYIAFDLDALNVARDVGAAAGISEERVTHGLLRMWAWCFREKTEHVTATHVRGFFGAACEVPLLAFGFLAHAEGFDCAPEVTFRVRGAERYLRISEARSRGGKAASSNLIPGGPKRSPKPRLSRGPSSAPAEVQPSTTLGSGSALTPSTEHRAPNTKEEKLAPAARAPRESDRLLADFQEIIGSRYVYGGQKDAVAFAALRKTETLDEVSKRWRRGLSATGFLGVRTLAELRSKWNHLAQEPSGNPKAPAPVADWSNAVSGEIPA